MTHNGDILLANITKGQSLKQEFLRGSHLLLLSPSYSVATKKETGPSLRKGVATRRFL